MDNPENQAGLQLPAPVNEQAPASQGMVPAGLEKSSEQGPSGAEIVGSPAAGMPASIPLPMPPTAPQSTNIAVQTDVSTTTQIATPAVADDGDLIEKEWVEKAKKIVEANRDDPYKQSEELTAVKADYMQKRYNKTIKIK